MHAGGHRAVKDNKYLVVQYSHIVILLIIVVAFLKLAAKCSQFSKSS